MIHLTMMYDIAKNYFELLGGDTKKFPQQTRLRVIKFKAELEQKRDYTKFTTFESKVDEMIVINGLKIFSFCEHHLLPYFGYGSIGYIPNGKIFGLSKFQRVISKLDSQPTIQENLTSEIADFVAKILEPKGIGVALTCIHTCMYGRGIDTSTITVNSQVLKGRMNDGTVRAEFLNRINHENIFR